MPGVEDPLGQCSTLDNACGQVPAILELPPPQGPRCLEAAYDCGPRDPGALQIAVIGVAHCAAAVTIPRRGPGTLPLGVADPPQPRPWTRALAVEPPPPR
ncbi:MAG: hypothetical protein KC613_26010 [Myxococcales bacterium]|nr:hypothetical protein [Myxococcales bacterium]MCB9522015.1 hypothetical protein [Myxococcales bacterium]